MLAMSSSVIKKMSIPVALDIDFRRQAREVVVTNEKIIDKDYRFKAGRGMGGWGGG